MGFFSCYFFNLFCSVGLLGGQLLLLEWGAVGCSTGLPAVTGCSGQAVWDRIWKLKREEIKYKVFLVLQRGWALGQILHGSC